MRPIHVRSTTDINAREDTRTVAQVMPPMGVAPPENTRESDFELACCVARGGYESVAALEVLFNRHSQPLLRFLCRYLRDETEAEDVVQDVFIRLSERAGMFRNESPFRTWLFTMALNLIRSKHRRDTLKDGAGNQLLQRRPELAGPKPEHDPSWRIQHSELMQKVDAAITALPEGERAIFLLYWFGEMSYAEISEMTDVSIPAAKVRVHRALARLSKVLAPLR